MDIGDNGPAAFTAAPMDMRKPTKKLFNSRAYAYVHRYATRRCTDVDWHAFQNIRSPHWRAVVRSVWIRRTSVAPQQRFRHIGAAIPNKQNHWVELWAEWQAFQRHVAEPVQPTDDV